MQTATADPLVGRALEGRYRIQERIARGGMSTVYSAIDERLDRAVAVKVMSAALSSDPAFSDRFAREARAAARLAHVNAVSVYDQGTETLGAGEIVFLVMELVSGRTLRDLLREKGRLEPALAVSIMEPVLGALSAAHQRGLVHRDIKPENILLSDDGVVKVADFGLAHAVEADASSTRTGLMMGTVAYCSPEQISKGRTDQRSDVYSAGVVLYELLTGEAPFSGDTAMSVAYQHVHSRVPTPSTKVKGLPAQLDDLVLRATEPEPGSRMLDAGAFLAELADVRSDLDLPVVPVPARKRVNNKTRTATPRLPMLGRKDTGHSTDVMGVMGAVHDTSVHERGVHRTAPDPNAPPPPVVTPPRRTASPRARRRRRTLLVFLAVLLVGLGTGFGSWWAFSGRYAEVPGVASLTQAEARVKVEAAGFSVPPAVRSDFSETVPKDRVIGTDPRDGSRVQKGEVVTLIVSRGQERYKVPDIRNAAEATVATALGVIRNVQIVYLHPKHDTVPKGRVIKTDPVAGREVRAGDTITVSVSDGPPILSVPDVTNQKFTEAEKTLKKVGFKVTKTEAFSDTVPEGTVISQAPLGSEQKPKGSTVVLTVSKGPEMVAVPPIPSLTPLDEAIRIVRAAGFEVATEPAFGGTQRRVVGMSPGAGSIQRKGSVVTLTYI